MSDSIDNDLDLADQLLARRTIVPDTDAKLAERIIMTSKGLPQEAATPVASIFWRSLFAKIFSDKPFGTGSLVSAVAVCLMLVVISGVWFSPLIQSSNTPGAITSTDLESTGLEDDTLGEEFSWDSLLIMQEEIAFAEL